jgi:hypothetical protein
MYGATPVRARIGQACVEGVPRARAISLAAHDPRVHEIVGLHEFGSGHQLLVHICQMSMVYGSHLSSEWVHQSHWFITHDGSRQPFGLVRGLVRL